MADPSRPVTGYPAANGHPHPNTAYPYPAQPPPSSQQYQYPPYYYAPPPRDRRVTLFRSILLGIISATIIFGAVLLIFWLVVRPRLPEFQITSLSVSNFATNDSRVTGKWDVRLRVYNPNKKMTVSYYEVVSLIYYKKAFLTRTQLPPFKQDTRNTTDIRATLSTVDTYVDGKAVDSMNSDRSGGSVKFNLRLESIAGFRYGAWRTRRKLVIAWCNDVPINVSSRGSGNLVGEARNCRVGM